MSKIPVQFVIAFFAAEEGAEETLTALKDHKEEALEGMQGAVAMCKDAQNQIRYQDVGMTPERGALAGVVFGAVVGLVTGGTGLALGAVGALLGGMMGRRTRDSQIASEQVNQVLASIEPGSSALLSVVETPAVPAFESVMHKAGAHTFVSDISADLAAEFDAHQNIAHAALLEKLDS